MKQHRYLGKYRLLAHLGEGGMASIYLACTNGPNNFTKLVVIKELKASLASDADYHRMFSEEARISAYLSHPHLVGSHDFGSDNDRLYFAMDFVDGQPLYRVVERLSYCKTFDRRWGIHWLLQVLDALEYAHHLKSFDGEDLELVHRDISPHNIMIGYDGRAKLVDFGIAKFRGNSNHTRAGTLKGKASYMSPEQAQGAPVDHRSDIFSLRVILYEILSGERMWQHAADLVIIGKLIRGDIPNLSEHAQRIPNNLVRVVDRATEAKKEDRFQSAKEFRTALELALKSTGPMIAEDEMIRALDSGFSKERTKLRSLLDTAFAEADLLDEDAIEFIDDEIPDINFDASTWSKHQSALSHHSTNRNENTAHERSRNTSRKARSETRFNASDALIDENHYRYRNIKFALAGFALLVGVAATSYSIAGRINQQDIVTIEEHSLLGTHSASAPTSEPSKDCNTKKKDLVTLSGDIESNATLSCDKDYLLEYIVRVKKGVTLNIEKGTHLYGSKEHDGTLVIERGAKLIANGTEDMPIVFTSDQPEGQRAPGDWGGVVLLGNAPTNLRAQDGSSQSGQVEGLSQDGAYGGNDSEDSSGSLRYIRIEYAGTEIAPGNELNGLTLAGVGSGTIVDHIQVRHSKDDCFEFFGGTVNAKYLLCQYPGDDGVDWDFGYTGKLQFVIVQQNVGGSNHGLEGDNDPNGSSNTPISEPVIYNATLCGMNQDLPQEQFGALVRRGSGLHLINSIVTGFEAGIDLRDANSSIDIRGSIFHGNLVHNISYPLKKRNSGRFDGDSQIDERKVFNDPENFNSERFPNLGDCFNADEPRFYPATPLIATDTLPPDDGFFDTSANFIGAVRDRQDNWATRSWAQWTTR